MDQIVDPLNLSKAYQRVRSNGGSAGVDGMEVEALRCWLGTHLTELQDQLLPGTYEPRAVRGVEIPKPHGGKRLLGIPTVKDRLVQQAVHQVLSARYERIFSANSYGFRANKSAHQALKAAGIFIASGKGYVIDLDLEKFFDEVNHHRLMWLLKTRIGDNRVLQLIHRYLKAGMMHGGLTGQRIKGTPQGSPLSPILSNIVLDELDKELERRGHSYVRYADDVKIFVSSERRAKEVKESITGYIMDMLKLKVNGSKSRICRGAKLNFLGHSIFNDGTPGLSRASERRLKDRLRKLTRRNKGVSLDRIIGQLRTKLQGWLNYFRYARMKSKMESVDGWLRRKLKCFRLKQCKRRIGIVRWLRKLGVEETLSWRVALSGKGWWRLSNSPALNMGMDKLWFAQQGYYSLSENYKSLHRKLL
ncbi:group II intron reverse transcriptase/maturase [Chitinophaga caeni]|uniref:RNA-directed DNA polymerase n=1 Tax=Chitinophaga caeni TaxID=2029983 RepID=A0A291R176_9BACT|nr:group II intron reverse transcriptase/maturase [Chitinophaga caeni]ATL49976.1 group II intron reverse transcriptase/maturase [Chitinophaga caeni]